MPKLPRDLPSERLARFLRRHGWSVAREGGRHTVLERAGLHVAVPRHGKLKVGTVAAILRQTGPWADEDLARLWPRNRCLVPLRWPAMDQPPRRGPPVGPRIHPTAVLAPGAVVIGQVTIEEGCFIGPNAVLRGDIEPILVRRGSNVQDNCTIHTERGSPVAIGPDASIGHGAVVHGATIGERALVGMNAVVLNGATVGERAVVGALALVPNGFAVPPRTLAVGAPCVLKKQGDAGIAEMAYQNTERYHRYREEHLAGLWRTVVGPMNDNGAYPR